MAKTPTSGVKALDDSLKGVEKTGGVIAEILSSFVGPLALAYGAAFAFLGVLGKVLGTGRLISRSLQEWARIQIYTPQFEKLLGSLAAAQQRLKEISNLSRGAFKFEDLAQANKVLEVFTRGALSGKEGMELISDNAAVANVSTTRMAAVIGQLYDDLSNHKPIDGYVQQLREMGVISSATADDLTNLSYSGASSVVIWNAVEDALRRNTGSASALKNTVAGLQQSLENTRAEELGKIGQMFEEGKMAGLRAAIMLVEKLGPILRDVLGPIAAIYNGLGRFFEAVAKLVTSIPALGAGLKMLVTFFVLLSTALAAKAVLEIVNILTRLSAILLGLGARAGVFNVLTAGMALMARQALRLLGPIGLVILGLQTLLALAGKFGSDNAMTDRQRKMAEDIRKTTDEIRKQAEELASGKMNAGSRGGLLARAAENVAAADTASKEARENAEKQGKSSLLADILGNAGMGAVTGWMLGGPWGAAAGALGGGAYGAISHQMNVADAERQSEDARKNQEEAMRAFVEAMNAKPKEKPAEYLNNPYFEQMQAESQARLNDLSARYAALSEDQRAGKEGAEIRASMVEEQTKFTRENQELAFNKYMESLGTQARLQHAIGYRTGDMEAVRRGDAMEDEAFTAKRVKELVENFKFDPEEAKRMTEGELLERQAARERERNPTVASGRARLGFAQGEAAGGSSEEARILNKMLQIMQSQRSPTYQIPP